MRLDPLVIYDPEIERWINGVDGATRILRQELVESWRSTGLDYGQFSPVQVKQSLGGLIWAFSERLGRYWLPPRLFEFKDSRMTAEQVRDLYHAVAQDRQGRRAGVCDEKIVNVQAASWRRGISHYKRLWLMLLPKSQGVNGLSQSLLTG